jgi:multidrug resistance efflux pump
MNDTETQAKYVGTELQPTPDWPERPSAAGRESALKRTFGWLIRHSRVAITLTAVAFAVLAAWKLWAVYMSAPWTRDATVRAHVVTMAPEVAGRVVELPVRDNQFVRKGDLLMVIDPTDYRIAVALAEAQVAQTKATEENALAQTTRRDKLTISVSDETKQTFKTTWLSADASHRQALANLEQARVKLERTRIVSPVNGYVTNLLAHFGNYANAGQNLISLVDADSFWVDGYFEETNLASIRVGNAAQIKLMAHSQILRGHVDSIARGINVSNAQPSGQGLANVNPIFTWVRLAQRIPVRIHIDEVPSDIILSAGMTATVEIRESAPASATGRGWEREVPPRGAAAVN